jgi:hypothetical protein
MNENKGHRRHPWLGVLFWGIFSVGLLVQAFAPRLEITNNAFVMPPSLISEEKEVRPAEIIGKERRMQVLSGLLTGGGALGLAFYYYRHVLFRPRAP